MQDDTQSFIIRIWRETEEGTGDVEEWRGSIDYVNHAARLYFTDLPAVLHFIEKQLGWSRNSSAATTSNQSGAKGD